jgi:hypothetical protein
MGMRIAGFPVRTGARAPVFAMRAAPDVIADPPFTLLPEMTDGTFWPQLSRLASHAWPGPPTFGRNVEQPQCVAKKWPGAPWLSRIGPMARR